VSFLPYARPLLAVGIAALGAAGCTAASRRPPAGATVATLTYSGGLGGGSPWGLRLWEAGPRVRAHAFNGPRIAVRDTSVLRAGLRALVALAAAPPDTVAQDSILADGTRVAWLCGDGVGAHLTVRDPSGVRTLSGARCRRSAAETRFRRTADSVFARLTAWPGR
jgi:hypothetical protein